MSGQKASGSQITSFQGTHKSTAHLSQAPAVVSINTDLMLKTRPRKKKTIQDHSQNRDQQKGEGNGFGKFNHGLTNLLGT